MGLFDGLGDEASSDNEDDYGPTDIDVSADGFGQI